MSAMIEGAFAPRASVTLSMVSVARPPMVGSIYTAIIKGTVIIVALGITCGFLTSPAIVDIDSYPEYIHIPRAMPIPM